MTEELKRVVIKEELVALTRDYKKAIILNQFLYWSKRVKDADKFIKEERKRLVSHGMSEEDIVIDLQNGWIYKTAEEMSEETMMGISKGNMGKHIDYLVENGWIDKRRNPKYKWDKTFQYRVNILKLQQDLQTLGYALEGYPLYQEENTEVTKRNSEVSQTAHRSNETLPRSPETLLRNQQNVTAIPEITSEITSEIKDIYPSASRISKNQKSKPKKDELPPWVANQMNGNNQNVQESQLSPEQQAEVARLLSKLEEL